LEPNIWNLQLQEREGTYTFSGKILITNNICKALTFDEQLFIIMAVRQRVEKLGGADYLQVFKNSKGETIFVIDQLNKEMKEENSDEFVKENDYFTILFSYEY